MDALKTRFAELLALQAERKLPPVHRWHPPLSGSIDIHIDRAGAWYHDGRKIERDALVNLFSTILRKEDEDYYLITPVEKWQISVEDVPFVVIAVDVDDSGQNFCFTTNVGDYVVAGAAHPLLFRREVPYLLIRDGLLGRLSSAVYYQLAAHVRAEGEAFYLDCADGPLLLQSRSS